MAYEALFQPLRIKGLTIKNRIMSSGHAPGYAEGGMPKERYQLYHEEKAKGGLGLTIFGGSSSVAIDSPAAVFNQISVSDDRVIPFFREMADRIHRYGAATFCQLTHMGGRARFDNGNWPVLLSSSNSREPQHRSAAKAMEPWDIRRVVKNYAAAARRCLEGGLDGCEISASGPHLIGQFLTPAINNRDDEYGGSAENRERFGIEVLEAIRKEVGPDFIVGLRLSGDEMMQGGLSQNDCIDIASRFARSGNVDYLTIMGGNVHSDAGFVHSLPNMSFKLAPYLHLASAIRAVVDLPIFHPTRIIDPETANWAVAEGHVDIVAMTRAHIADPHLVRKLATGHAKDIRTCVGASYCLARPGGGDAVCIQNAATGREASLPHIVPKAEVRRRIVVVGGGPAGLEAARVSAARGHEVILYESKLELGGQVNIAARATWRRDLRGITDWLESQVRSSGVDVRLNTRTNGIDIFEAEPDVVVIATGGQPHTANIPGGDLARSTWDILTGREKPGQEILIVDNLGDHQAVSCAEVVASVGAKVEIITPDRALGLEIGTGNWPIHHRELHKLGVITTTNTRLNRIEKDGNRLTAVLRNEHSGLEEQRSIDQVVLENGTIPRADLYFDLVPYSHNEGEVDLDALETGRPQIIRTNAEGRFQLFRIGDAVVGRNIYAAIYDALRLCKDF